MKIIKGISNVSREDDIKAYIDAGTDKFFIGYIPEELILIPAFNRNIFNI